MRSQKFGIEIEFTGITRSKAAKCIAKYFNSTAEAGGGMLDAYRVTDDQRRRWSIVRDASIDAERAGETHASHHYKVELVSPICTYEDIPKIQELVRLLRREGARVNSSCGIHVHVDASKHNARSLRNLCNIMVAKEDLLYKALVVEVERSKRFAKKVNLDFIDNINRRKPKTLQDVSRLWYGGNSRSNRHYDPSRYHALNLHSVFRTGTIEFRLFNGTLHAGKIKSYIQLSLAISHQALVQKGASHLRTQTQNDKYTFRTWLLRLGMIGDEFKSARKHLLANLEGEIAWLTTEQRVAQQEKRRKQQEQDLQVEEGPQEEMTYEIEQ